MKLPCGGCGKYTPGQVYDPSIGCFFCWSSQHSTQYRNYWEDADKVTPISPAKISESSPRSYEPQYNPYHQAPRESATIHCPPTEKPAEPVPEPARSANCVHLGAENGQIQCASCGGKVMVKTFDCMIYGTCTIAKKVGEMACCDGGRCPSYSLVAKLPDGNS